MVQQVNGSAQRGGHVSENGSSKSGKKKKNGKTPTEAAQDALECLAKEERRENESLEGNGLRTEKTAKSSSKMPFGSMLDMESVVHKAALATGCLASVSMCDGRKFEGQLFVFGGQGDVILSNVVQLENGLPVPDEELLFMHIERSDYVSISVREVPRRYEERKPDLPSVPSETSSSCEASFASSLSTSSSAASLDDVPQPIVKPNVVDSNKVDARNHQKQEQRRPEQPAPQVFTQRPERVIERSESFEPRRQERPSQFVRQRSTQHPAKPISNGHGAPPGHAVAQRALSTPQSVPSSPKIDIMPRRVQPAAVQRNAWKPSPQESTRYNRMVSELASSDPSHASSTPTTTNPDKRETTHPSTEEDIFTSKAVTNPWASDSNVWHRRQLKETQPATENHDDREHFYDRFERSVKSLNPDAQEFVPNGTPMGFMMNDAFCGEPASANFPCTAPSEVPNGGLVNPEFGQPGLDIRGVPIFIPVETAVGGPGFYHHVPHPASPSGTILVPLLNPLDNFYLAMLHHQQQQQLAQVMPVGPPELFMQQHQVPHSPSISEEAPKDQISDQVSEERFEILHQEEHDNAGGLEPIGF